MTILSKTVSTAHTFDDAAPQYVIALDPQYLRVTLLWREGGSAQFSFLISTLSAGNQTKIATLVAAALQAAIASDGLA